MLELERTALYKTDIVKKIITERSKAGYNPMFGNPRPSGEFLRVDNQSSYVLKLTMAEDQGKDQEQSTRPNILDAMKRRLGEYTKKFETGTSPAAPYLRKDVLNPLAKTQEMNVVKSREETLKPPTKRPQ